jgi:hypothetical protein
MRQAAQLAAWIREESRQWVLARYSCLLEFSSGSVFNFLFDWLLNSNILLLKHVSSHVLFYIDLDLPNDNNHTSCVLVYYNLLGSIPAASPFIC